jgi:uncharacterized protein YkwD
MHPAFLAAVFALQSIDIGGQTVLLSPLSSRPHSTRVVARDEALLFNAVNGERASRGLPPLVYSPRLSQTARSHSREMATKGYFGHTSPSGLTCFQRMVNFGVPLAGHFAGENIALDSNEAHADAAMMASPGHRENILDPHFTRLGVGVIEDQDAIRFYSEEFLQAPKVPPPQPPLTPEAQREGATLATAVLLPRNFQARVSALRHC